MADKEPLSAEALTDDGAALLPWGEARRRLVEARFYWLGTVRPDGGPHVRPVLAVWVDGSLHSTTNPSTRKGRNVYRVTPAVVFGLGTDAAFAPRSTRWRFSE